MPSFSPNAHRTLTRTGRTIGLLLVLLATAVAPLWFTGWTRAQGSDEIPLRKHTLDLGPSETVAIADVNRDGRLGYADRPC